MLGVVVWAGTIAAVGSADVCINNSRITATVLGLALLALGCGTVALAARALTGRHGLVLGITTAPVVDLANAVAPAGRWRWRALRKLAPFYCYLRGDPLRTGLDLGHLAVLATIPRALLAVGVWSLNRRDIASMSGRRSSPSARRRSSFPFDLAAGGAGDLAAATVLVA